VRTHVILEIFYFIYACSILILDDILLVTS